MDLPADLERVLAYPELRPAEVERRETHISWVFLLENDVFKLKKPVDLGFLDFRSLDARRVACEAEVRLNERLAPGVYLGVKPVRRGPDGRAWLGDIGPVVDWAVHMRRLDDADRLDVRLSRGDLDPATLEAVAARLANFHASAHTDETIARYGQPERIAANVRENFVQTAGTLERLVSPAEADEIVRWQTDFLQDNEALLAARIRAGRVRDGHGDLRLEHVYVSDAGAITILDCIEFNERFRFGDVASDVAFLSMDLAANGRVDLAERFLAAYARETNDYDLYALVDFYEGYRAYVRGKIASITGSETTLPSAARERAEALARRFFLLALSMHRRALLSPTLVAVGGIIASGKTTIAERIANELNAPHIEADRTRKGMLGVGALAPMHDAAWSGAYDPAFTQRVYEEVLRRADVVLRSGRPVVVDASFRSARMRDDARRLASRYGVAFRFVECKVDPEVGRARLAERQRTASTSDGRLAIFDDFVARFEPITELDPNELVVLDTACPIERSLATLREAIATWPIGFSA